MSDKLALRNRIEKFFNEVGAEVMLYEKTLTPSTNKLTYREDIKEADFVIFILDEHYGSKTSLGLSGTEEEYRIVSQLNQKLHIYLKDTSPIDLNDDALAFEKEIKQSGYSYYYYKDEKTLCQRIKQTTFTIAKEIALYQLDKEKFDNKTMLKISKNYDYGIAIGYISLHNKLIELSKDYDAIETNLFVEMTDYAEESIFGNINRFVDRKMYDYLFKAYNIARIFNNKHVNDYTSTGRNGIKYEIPIYKEIEIHRLIPNEPIDRNWYKQKINEYIEAFKEFITYVEQKNTDINTITFK